MAKKKVAKPAAVKASKKSAAKGKTITKEIAKQYLNDPDAVGLNDFLEHATAIDDEAAEVLGRRNCYLPLNSLRQLTVTAARGLTQTTSHLRLDGLESLPPGLAEALATRPRESQSLSLNGITTIGVEEARTLAKVASYRLELGLTSLSDAVSEELGKREGHLSLDALVTLSDYAAACLARVRGTLSLNGVTTLSDIAAKSLGTLKSDFSNGRGLYLDGLTSLSKAACIALSKVIQGEDGFCTNPMKPGRPVDPHRSQKESTRDQIFFRHLFAHRTEERAKKVQRYLSSADAIAAVRKLESQIYADPQSGRLHFLDASSMAVTAAVTLAVHKEAIACPGFIGFSDGEEKDHDWHAVGDAVVRYLQKVPGHGPRCVTLGGLLIELMLASGQPRALAQLLRVARDIKIIATRQWIETRVAWRAQEAGTSAQAIEDATIDTHGFGEPAQRLAKLQKGAKASKRSRKAKGSHGKKK